LRSSGGGRAESSEEVRSGGGGRGLFRSVGVRVSEGLVNAGLGRLWVLDDSRLAEKSSKATVCGALGETSFPCLCFGSGGFFFSTFVSSAIKVARSSSPDTERSYDVRGVSV
jgi:hypothetical protein